jgi:hypothetical protein
MVPVSFAKQTKSQEERLYSRFRELNPDAVRVTRYRNGTIMEEVLLLQGDHPQWITAVVAEGLLSQHNRQKSIERNIARALLRLGRVINEEEYQALPENELNLLQMSQKEFNSFGTFKKVKGGGFAAPKGEGEENFPPIGAFAPRQ